MSEPAISVRRLSKRYRLGTIGRHTLVDEVAYAWHRFRGRNPREHMGTIGHTVTEARRVAHEREGAGEFWALKDVSFDIQPGEVVGIVGSNGAGKSTLLKILSRITEPTEGEAFLNGRVGSLLEVGTGFHPELTGRENIYMNGVILGMKKREIDAKFDEIVAFAEIETFIDTPVKRYSSGMYVRLAFAVAAHLEPEIMLVDEVLAVGDLAFQNKCLNKMHDMAHAARTVLFVSHNMGAVRAICDRAVWLENGAVRAAGEAEDVVRDYQAAALEQRTPDGGRFERPERDVTPGRLTWVRALEIRDAHDRPCTRFKYGDALRLVFHLGGQPPRAGCGLIWILYDLNGAPLGWSNSALTHGFSMEHGQRSGVCCFEALPLAAGRYHLSVSCGIAGGGEVKDIWRQAAAFDIVACDPFGSRHEQRAGPFGSVILPHAWRPV